MTKQTAYAKAVAKWPTPDEERTVTLDEAKALGGMIGPIAAAMLKRHGVYGYTAVDGKVERTILLRLA